MQDLLKLLRGNPYPGRGIVAGSRRVYYFIMGRSENSRNRVFIKTEYGIRIEAYDPSRLTDPSLTIYSPVWEMGPSLIVSNGDQTDSIRLAADFRHGLMKRSYEPDAPNWTPRISALLHAEGSIELSVIKRTEDGRCTHQFFYYEGCGAGTGYFISTYRGDGNPLPSFSGEPILVTMPEPEEVWDALDAENKVSLYANVDGRVKLFNKNLGD